MPLQVGMHFLNNDPRCTVTTQTLSPILAFPCRMEARKPEKTECHGGSISPDATDGVTIDILSETDKATSSEKSYRHGWFCISTALSLQSYDLLQMARSRAEIWLGEARI